MFFLLFGKIVFGSLEGIFHYAEIKKKEWKVPGSLYIGVVIKDGIESTFIEKHFDRTKLLPMSSLTENFTFTLIGALVEENLIRLDDPVKKYLPDFPFPDLTIEHILMGQAEMFNFPGDALIRLGFSFPEVYEKLKSTATLRLSTGAQPRVPMGGQNVFLTSLLEKVVEKITKKAFNDAAREYLFSPLCLYVANYTALKKKTAFLSGCVQAYKLPKQHISQGLHTDKEIPLSPTMHEFKASIGFSINYCTLMKWLQYVMRPTSTIVSWEFLKEMFSPKTTFTPTSEDIQFIPSRVIGPISRGFGWMQMNYAGHKVYFNRGSWDGMRSYILFDPAKKFGLVMWHNYGGDNVNLFPEALVAKFLDMAYDIPASYDWVDEMEKTLRKRRKELREKFAKEKLLRSPVSPLRNLCGIYQNTLYGPIEVVEAKGILYMNYRHHKIKLRHHNGDKFTFDPQDISPFFDHSVDQWVDFKKDQSGRRTLQNSLMLEGEPWFVKIS